MSAPEFENVLEEERRFSLIEEPDSRDWEPEIRPSWAKDLTAEQLERWRIETILANKMEWIIRMLVILNNHSYHNETEIIRSRKFRSYIWTRMTFVVALITIIGHLLLPMIREKLFPVPQNPHILHVP